MNPFELTIFDFIRSLRGAAVTYYGLPCDGPGFDSLKMI